MAAHEISPVFDVEDQSQSRRQHAVDHALELERSKEVLNDPMMKLKWFHPFLTRHAAECMLIDNAPEGTYLLRPSATGGSKEYSLSVKFSRSVQHMKVQVMPDGRYRFGHSNFEGVNNLKKHFEQEKPNVGGDSGMTVTLKYPYCRDVEEQHTYTVIQHHAVTNVVDSESSDEDGEEDSRYTSLERKVQHMIPVSSREGYLTKQGRIIKTWKVRWFVLRNTNLSYYKTKQSVRPINVINMLEADSVDYDNSKGKDFCFSVRLPKRTYFFYANSHEDCEQWLELLSSKILVRKPQGSKGGSSPRKSKSDSTRF